MTCLLPTIPDLAFIILHASIGTVGGLWLGMRLARNVKQGAKDRVEIITGSGS